MPYVDQKSRRRLEKHPTAKSTGDLNYLITKVIKKYVESFPRLSYDTFNWIMGVMEEIKHDISHRGFGQYHTKGFRNDIQNHVINYVKKFPHISEHEITQIRGVLTCVQLELYRRVISSYEDIKCKSNGDVYT